MVDSLTGEPIAITPTDRLAPLVPTGSPAGTPATAWYGGIGMGQSSVDSLTALEGAGQLPAGLTYVLCDQTDSRNYVIIRTNHPAGEAFIGQQWWAGSMAVALEIVGLQSPAAEV